MMPGESVWPPRSLRIRCSRISDLTGRRATRRASTSFRSAPRVVALGDIWIDISRVLMVLRVLRVLVLRVLRVLRVLVLRVLRVPGCWCEALPPAPLAPLAPLAPAPLAPLAPR